MPPMQRDTPSVAQQTGVDGGLRQDGSKRQPDRSPIPILSSDIYREIIGAAPPFAVHSGPTTVALGMVAFLIFAGLLPYPVTISSQVKLVSVPTAAPLVAHASGRIALFQLADGESVVKGEVLAVISDSGDFRQIMMLREWLSGLPLAIDPGSNLPPLPPVSPSNLGECEAAFADVSQALADFQSFRISAPMQQQLAQLQSESRIYLGMIILLRQKQKAADEAQAASADSLNGQRKLIAAGMASSAYVDNYIDELESKREQAIDSQIALNSNKLDVLQTENEIESAVSSDQAHQQALLDELAGALDKLRQAVSTWELAHVLRAPEFGILHLFDFWADDQEINSGDQFALVVPKQTQVIGVALVQALGIGSVHVGDLALISLDAYPDAQFGPLTGTVSAISSVAMDGKYRVFIILPRGLISARGNSLGFTQNMSGTVRINVRSISILHRLFLGLTWNR